MEVFSLRPFTILDLDSLVVHANNPKIAQNMTNQFPHPYTAENGRFFIEHVAVGGTSHIKAIVVDNRAVGAIGLHPQTDIFCKNAELGYWLGEAHWNKGIMTEAIRQMVVYGFKNLAIQRIFARPFGQNFASQRVLENAGFRLEARLEKTLFKNGVFMDEYIYGVRR